jgi:hypothetical protein
VIIRGAPGEAGNRAAISLCLEQSKDNRPESPYWKLGCLVDGDSIILFWRRGFIFDFGRLFTLPEQKKFLPTRIRTRDLEISVVKPSTVSRSAN